MLQEILLSLSGVPSPIWKKLGDRQDNGEGFNHYASPSEQTMLATLAHISQLHIELKENTNNISLTHSSLVCRAVSSSIAHKHLAAFRRRIVEVEASILREDATHVGGYQIVPLSTLVVDFAPWRRRLEWLQSVTTVMRSTKSRKSSTACTAAAIMKHLDHERHTGYADLEDIATQLLIVAQSTWMRSISAWILYGQLPLPGNDDFMIQRTPEEDPWMQCVLETALVPQFVSSKAAECCLAIGNALRQIQSPGTLTQSGLSQGHMHLTLASHLALIKSIEIPFNPALFESTISKINDSISRHALSHLLPRNQVIGLFVVLKEYMLLGRGEFAMALIENSDTRIDTRQQSQSNSRAVRKLGRIDDMVMKEAEIDTILSKTWSDLATQRGQNELEDGSFDTARKYLKLHAMRNTEESPAGPYLTTILPTPTLLNIQIPTDSVLNILLSPWVTREYARIDAYLLSIRRSQLRLSNLWKLTSHRRCYPPPPGPPLSTTEFGQQACKQRRMRENLRGVKMRKFWSSLNKSLFLLNELNYYLHGEVIGNSWKHFQTWLDLRHDDNHHPSDDERPVSRLKNGLGMKSMLSQPAASEYNPNITQTGDDPRILAQAHSAYLANLANALLSKDDSFVSALKSFLELIDHFIALFSRLSVVWEGLDLQEDDGVMDAFTNHVQDEEETLAQMNRARTSLEELLLRLVNCISTIEKTQDVNDVSATLSNVGILRGSRDNFVPWRARTLDRLIMKLDFLSGEDESATVIVDEDEYD